MSQTIDGLVLYTDGSFRRQKAGWGVHGYSYTNTPLKQGIGVKTVPTTQGYRTVDLTETVTVVEYIDGFGHVLKDPSNNTGELEGVIQALEIALTYDTKELTLYMDSDYVRKGITSHIKKWIKNDWRKADGEPVANITYWKRLVALEALWNDGGRKVNFLRVNGHSGDLGNDLADLNARTGSGSDTANFVTRTPPDKYHNPESKSNPLYLKTRMLFNVGGAKESHALGQYYYMYQLGRMQTYGHKQDDSLKERHDKTDLLLGRRISDATFMVVHLDEPDEYLEFLMDIHAKHHLGEVVELGVARLDNAYKPSVYQRIMQLREHAVIPVADNYSLITPQDELITKTLNPPRLAMEAVGQFTVMQKRLESVMQGAVGKGVVQVDITEQLYGTETKGKKTVTKLHKTITNQTPSIDFKVPFKDQEIDVKLILGIDIPARNPLAKLADFEPKVQVLIVADGPFAYSYATVFTTTTGRAIYQSPYTQFILPKK